uniref:EF-hand domain-containing protein n=1 Tax=Podarcis muralis TaxID=64176 RepID=A0A670ITR2_PODMU
ARLLVLSCPTSPLLPPQALAKETQAQSEKLAGLEAVAMRMKGFSRKQDCGVIHSLVLTAKERLAKVAQHVGERGGQLEEARKRTKQVWRPLGNLLSHGSFSRRGVLCVPPCSPDWVLCPPLPPLQEFQKGLRAKRPVYEATLRSGRLLREKALLPDDTQTLEEMLGELRGQWEAICGRAAERQRKLEEGLLFSGRFTDALQTLMDWLYRAEPQLAEETPVGGDRDLVSALMDKHKVFQKELGQRASCIKALRRSLRDLMRGSSGGAGDSQWLQSQVEELSHRWEIVCQLSVSKQDRLEAALRQAEEFHALVNSFLGRLMELEKSIKFGALPSEEADLRQSLQCQQLQLECISSLGEEILSTSHPDSVITIRSWVTVARSRFEEVLSWAQQQEERLQVQAASLATEREEVARLMDWITAAEEALSLRDEEPLPEDAEQLEELSAQHGVFMEELTHKQPDVERVTKSCKRKTAPEAGGMAPGSRKLPSRKCPSLKANSPLLAQLVQRWQQLWLLALDRQYRLQNAQQRQRELEEFAHFDFSVWRKRYMQWISQMKSRILDVFRGIDRDQDGRITQQEFIESVLSSSECRRARCPGRGRSGGVGVGNTSTVSWTSWMQRAGRGTSQGTPRGRRFRAHELVVGQGCLVRGSRLGAGGVGG